MWYKGCGVGGVGWECGVRGGGCGVRVWAGSVV